MPHQISKSSSVHRFARRLENVEREVRALGSIPQLPHSSVDGGNLDFNDENGLPLLTVGKLPDGTAGPLVVGGPPPPGITGVSLTVVSLGVVVSWDGGWEGEAGVAPLDFARTEVHVSELGADFIPDLVGPRSSTLRGTFSSPRGGRLALTDLDPEKSYWLKLVPRTLTGKWGPSSPVIGPFSPGRLSRSDFDTDFLSAGFILTGALQVGDIGQPNPIIISGTGGITAPQPDGGEFRIPVDGSPARLTGHVIAFSMFIKDRFQISGGGTLGGTIELTARTTTPAAPPTLYVEWPSVSTLHVTPGVDIGHTDRIQGLTQCHTNADWLMSAVTVEAFGTWHTHLRPMHRTTGALVAYPDPTSGKAWTSGFRSVGGVAYLNGHYYVMGLDLTRGRVYIYKIDATTFDKVGEVVFGWGPNPQGSSRPRLVAVGADIWVIWKHPEDGDLRSRVLTQSLVQSGADQSIEPAWSLHHQLGDVYYGYAGTGAQYLYVASRIGDSTNSQRIVRCYNVNSIGQGSRVMGLDFPHADGTQVIGLHFDAVQGRMVSLSNNATLLTYSKFAGPLTIISARYTWYDGDPSPYPPGTYRGTVDVSGLPSGTRETLPSPPGGAVLWNRSWPVIECPPPPDEAVVDPLRVDRANRIGLYIGVGLPESTSFLRWGYLSNVDGRAERVVRGFDTIPGSGTPPTTDGFADAVMEPGVMRSGAMRLDGQPKLLMTGNGAGHFDGMISPGMMMFWHDISPPEGWLHCDGAAISRTSWPDLFAAIGTKYGAGDGSTTFNLPEPVHLPTGGSSYAAMVIRY